MKSVRRYGCILGLVQSADGEPLPPAPPLGDAQRFVALPLRLTEAGERVLAGRADRVELLGIDRWVGGTHVTVSSVWRWDSEHGRLT